MSRKKNPRPRRVTVIRYEDASGKRCRKGDPGARRVKTLSDSYYLHLPPRAPGAKRERIPLQTADETVAWHRVREILAERLAEDLGILGQAERHAARPIAEHLEEWLQSVADGGAQPKRVGMLRGRLGELVRLAEWKRIGDVTKSSCLRALAALQADAARGKGSAGRGRGISAQTRAHYASHARQFARWLVDDGRLARDPLATLGATSVEGDRRHDRRVPSDDEVRVLFDHLDRGQPKVRCGMSGPQRALAYQVMMCAGLRAGELRRLRPTSFDWESGDLRITGSSDKARKRRRQALPRWLLDKVRAWLDGGGGLWSGLPENSPGRLLVADLDLARNEWILAAPTPEERERRERSTCCCYEVQGEDGPTYLDMHAWRHWYISEVASVDGISPATLQSLSRHGDPKMTLGVYAKAKREGERDAVEQLPRLDGAAGESANGATKKLT